MLTRSRQRRSKLFVIIEKDTERLVEARLRIRSTLYYSWIYLRSQNLFIDDSSHFLPFIHRKSSVRYDRKRKRERERERERNGPARVKYHSVCSRCISGSEGEKLNEIILSVYLLEIASLALMFLI